MNGLFHAFLCHSLLVLWVARRRQPHTRLVLKIRLETEPHAKHDSAAGRGVDITDLALVAGASACLSKHGHSRVRTVSIAFDLHVNM